MSEPRAMGANQAGDVRAEETPLVRLVDLAIAESTIGLSDDEKRELAELRALVGLEPTSSDELSDPACFARVVAACDQAFVASTMALEPMPPALVEKCLRDGLGFVGRADARASGRLGLSSPAVEPTIGHSTVAGTIRPGLGWLAAAACLAIGAAGVYFGQRASLDAAAAVARKDEQIARLRELAPVEDPSQARQLLMARGEAGLGHVLASWSGWDGPELAGVAGDVVWCESRQEGYMRFTGLPANDPAKEQYQLWIIDRRGMSQRISGGVFDASDDTCVVPIRAAAPIVDAAAFAVTIEQPGGVAVSDMSRRVVIASVGRGE